MMFFQSSERRVLPTAARPCPAMALLVLLLLGMAPGLGRPLEPCPGPCRCRGRRLDCSRAALASVPPATRRRPFSELDLTGNALALIPPQAWKGYPWAEKLVLQDNSLRAVKRRSLEGLLLLRHLNLEGNLITEIRNDTFRAWHGMQFLQTLILSRNPLSVIEDTWFFKLPSVTHLDLSATRVTRQTLLMLLLRTSRLETLKLSNNTACCLCQHKHSTETPCRTLSFDCTSVCSTSAPRCAPLAETPGHLMGAVAPRKGSSSSILKVQPKEPLLTEQRTVTLAVVLSLTRPDASAPSPQQLSRQEGSTAKELTQMLQRVQHKGWSSSVDTRSFYFLAEGLVAQLRTKLHKTMSTLTLQIPSAARPLQRDEGQEVPAGQGGRATSWQYHEPGLGSSQAESTLWEAAQRLNLSDILPASNNQRAPIAPVAQPPPRYRTEAPHLAWSGGSQDHSDTVEQASTADGFQDEESAEDLDEAPSPAHNSAGSDTLLSHHLHSLVPDRAVQRFVEHMARALRGDCGLPQLQPACARMVSRTGLLLKLLSERQCDPEPSDILKQCVWEEDAGSSPPCAQVQAREMGSEPAETEMAKHTSGHTLLLAISLSCLNTFTLLVLCCFKVCAKKRDQASQASSGCGLKSCFQKLRPKCWSRTKDTDTDKNEGSLQSDPQWLQYLYLPLDAQQQASLDELYDGEASGEEEVFNERGIAWLSIGSHSVTAHGDSS
ncbi:leucine-rich repeat-containing protein 37A2-like isoform X3 [Strigops habroptila]|uniref:leucine-rich repeat-containing protein 37A2-like isoform X3 n=1 Tax=Strigops habroptila TaxID=2489341 RepID=UPI0011CFE163|nr:leucine-rich repeat-containing protein 37A2-like isoform X3 [Strigops habroptila]